MSCNRTGRNERNCPKCRTTSSCNSRHQCEVGSMSTQRGLKEKFCEEAPSTSNTVSDAADPFVSNSLSDIAMHLSNSRKRVRYSQSEAQFQHVTNYTYLSHATPCTKVQRNCSSCIYSVVDVIFNLDYFARVVAQA